MLTVDLGCTITRQHRQTRVAVFLVLDLRRIFECAECVKMIRGCRCIDAALRRERGSECRLRTTQHKTKRELGTGSSVVFGKEAHPVDRGFAGRPSCQRAVELLDLLQRTCARKISSAPHPQTTPNAMHCGPSRKTSISRASTRSPFSVLTIRLSSWIACERPQGHLSEHSA